MTRSSRTAIDAQMIMQIAEKITAAQQMKSATIQFLRYRNPKMFLRNSSGYFGERS